MVELQTLKEISPDVHLDQTRTDQSGPIYHSTAQALQAFDRETSLSSPTHATVTEQLAGAQILIEHGEHELAQTLLRSILQQDPYSTEAMRWLGHSFREQKHFAQAERCFSQWVRFDPNELSFLALADVQYVQGRDEHALANYLVALRFVETESPRLFEIFKNIGNICVRAGDYDSAEENYNRAYTLNPESDVLMVNFGTLEIQRENYDEAVTRFRAAVQFNSQNDRGWVGLALVHRHLGDFTLSWANLERALDLNPDNETALRLSIEWSLADYKLECAIQHLRTYLDRNGEDVTMALYLAQLLLASGNLDEARFEVERSLLLDPSSELGLQLQEQIGLAVQERQGLS